MSRRPCSVVKDAYNASDGSTGSAGNRYGSVIVRIPLLPEQRSQAFGYGEPANQQPGRPGGAGIYHT